MRVTEEGESDGGRTVVVGVKMDPESKELLTWALVKIARPGDRVVALHVIPEASAPNGKCTPLLSLVKTFDSVLAVYDGFCNLKQIDLNLKLCRGSSIRKVLVKETMASAASKLIVGTSKNSHGIMSSTTLIARYCSKKLPKDCSVIAVNNGKVLFQRDSKEDKHSSKPHHMFTIIARSKEFDARSPSVNCLPARLSCGSNIVRDDSIDHSCSFYCPMPSTPASPAPQLGKLRRDDSLALFPVKRVEALSKPGWPLLRKAVLNSKKSNSSQEKPKISVVQWAMRLPSRYTSPTVIHPHWKYADSGEENRAIVPVTRIDSSSSSSSLVIHDEGKELPEELQSLQAKYSSVCWLFSYRELRRATSNFASENLIGKGGSSRVYKGCLSDGKELAVKVLKQSEDALNEFISEIEIITTLHHSNIISLIGFCFEDENLMLVYDLLRKGSLEETLHGDKENKDARSLSWVERYKIALGVAEALDYLHGGGNIEPVIHRDVKSSNILLSEDFEPQLCDFGLAKWASSSSSHMTCNDVAGTFGYLAPEYFMYGKVNEKIDVYAFGVILLELLSGRKPIDMSSANGNESLVMWAKEILQGGKTKQLVDPCLGDKHDDDQMERMILATSLCIRRDPRCRPHIAPIMKLLQGDQNIVRWARAQVKASEESDNLDDEAVQPNSLIQSHIDLALLGVEDDTHSVCSIDHPASFITANNSLEDYLKGRWSRQSSFD
ncbi:receptor protein kinase TMK1 [Iris pallida]|uniref:Receptor protein kinase TMK1 n=1 Tax=Iris pallida TaxID=29817 RepID=A0AAX6FLT8_IRIPA|nr:receptor protein kinase TMK1 [Iris pallida]